MKLNKSHPYINENILPKLHECYFYFVYNCGTNYRRAIALSVPFLLKFVIFFFQFLCYYFSSFSLSFANNIFYYIVATLVSPLGIFWLIQLTQLNVFQRSFVFKRQYSGIQISNAMNKFRDLKFK